MALSSTALISEKNEPDSLGTVSCVVNRFPKDRAAAPPHFYVVAGHCHRRLDMAPIVRPFPFPGTLGKAQMPAAVVFFSQTSVPSPPWKSCAYCVENRTLRQRPIFVQNQGLWSG